jgi:phosphotransferase system HPr-like phosphotransfer protein
MKIKLTTIEDIRDFLLVTQSIDTEVTAMSGKYVVDAKSLMGLFALDLTKPIEIECKSSENIFFKKWGV